MERFKWIFGRNKQGRNHSYKKYTPLITDECNLSCSYCFQKYKGEGNVMTEEILKRFIDGVFKVEVTRQAHEDVFIQFCGGEALLYPELVDYGMTYMKETYLPFISKHMMINVLSNGTTLGDPKVREVLEKHPELNVSISIDGDMENHNKCRGGFDTIMDNLVWVKNHYARYNKKPRLSMTISPDNLDGFARGFKYLTGEIGIKEIWVSLALGDNRWDDDAVVSELHLQLLEIVDYMTLPENAIEVWTNLFDIDQFKPVNELAPVCSAITSQICCTPDGTLIPCYVYRNQSKEDFSIGDVYTWVDKDKNIKVCKNTISNTKGLEDCKQCTIGSGCKRCSGYFAEEYGEMYKGDTIFCKAHYAKYWALQYLKEKRWELINGVK